MLSSLKSPPRKAGLGRDAQTKPHWGRVGSECTAFQGLSEHLLDGGLQGPKVGSQGVVLSLFSQERA